MLLIFDLDGTLLDTIADLGCGANHALRVNGYPEHALEEYPHMVGNGVMRLLERALPEDKREEQIVTKLRADFIEYYNTHNRIHTRPYDGIAEMLLQLRADGHRLTVASNKYHEATTSLVHYYFGDLFEVVLGERPGVARKPDPQIVSDIRTAIGQDEEVLYIGDSDVDMQTAKNAGVESIACTWGFCSRETLLACQPDHIVNSAKEIVEIVKQKQGL